MSSGVRARGIKRPPRYVPEPLTVEDVQQRVAERRALRILAHLPQAQMKAEQVADERWAAEYIAALALRNDHDA